ncbi:MAG TPA: hypothetical protein VE570_11745 [Thermoleophilaceae bacterium]|jgi:hypothetical protein|nr:hypothetical protein [Thermoleophilaceae bacterium]
MSQAVALLTEPPGHLGRRTVRRLRKLTKDRTRRRLAAGLERAVADADAPQLRLSAAIPVQRRKVTGCRDELLELAERLRTPGPAYAHGIARAAGLLTDVDSPLYRSDGDLRAAVETALLALDGHLE